jgi:hypothetical protein
MEEALRRKAVGLGVRTAARFEWDYVDDPITIPWSVFDVLGREWPGVWAELVAAGADEADHDQYREAWRFGFCGG